MCELIMKTIFIDARYFIFNTILYIYINNIIEENCLQKQEQTSECKILTIKKKCN